MQVRTHVRTFVDWQTNVSEYTDDGVESLDIVCEGGETGASNSDRGVTCHKLLLSNRVWPVIAVLAYTIYCLVALT